MRVFILGFTVSDVSTAKHFIRGEHYDLERIKRRIVFPVKREFTSSDKLKRKLTLFVLRDPRIQLHTALVTYSICPHNPSDANLRALKFREITVPRRIIICNRVETPEPVQLFTSYENTAGRVRVSAVSY